MALPTLLSGSKSDTPSNPQATASVSPTTGRVLGLVVFSHAPGSAPTVTPTGLSGTWTQQFTTNGGNRRLTLHTCPDWTGTGAISMAFSEAPDYLFWAVIEMDDCDLGSPVAQAPTGNGTGTGVTGITAAAFANPANVGLLAAFHVANEASAAADGFTELHDDNAAFEQNVGFWIGYKAGEDTSPDGVTWATSSVWRAGFAELRVRRKGPLAGGKLAGSRHLAEGRLAR